MDVKEQLKRTGQKLTDALSSDAGAAGGTDVLKTLKKEHDELKALLSDLQKTEVAAERTLLVRKIKHALLPHAEAEEKVVYNAILALSDKESQIDGREGYVEHKLAAQTLEQLAGIADAKSPDHFARAKVLKELIEHHIKEEESNVWNDLRRHFSPADRVRMNQEFEKSKSHVTVA